MVSSFLVFFVIPDAQSAIRDRLEVERRLSVPALAALGRDDAPVV
jgi:hypothetical protein